MEEDLQREQGSSAREGFQLDLHQGMGISDVIQNLKNLKEKSADQNREFHSSGQNMTLEISLSLSVLQQTNIQEIIDKLDSLVSQLSSDDQAFLTGDKKTLIFENTYWIPSDENPEAESHRLNDLPPQDRLAHTIEPSPYIKNSRKAIIKQIENKKPVCKTQYRCRVIPKDWKTRKSYTYEVANSYDEYKQQGGTQGNLYFMSPSMSQPQYLEGEKALKAYFLCFFEESKDTFEIRVPQTSIPNFVDAMKNQCYYYYDNVEEYKDNEDNVTYIFDMKRAMLFKSKARAGGSSPSIARWMGAIAGTFVVVASAFVPRLG